MEVGIIELWLWGEWKAIFVFRVRLWSMRDEALPASKMQAIACPNVRAANPNANAANLKFLRKFYLLCQNRAISEIAYFNNLIKVVDGGTVMVIGKVVKE